MPAPETQAAYWTFFAAESERGDCPLYRRLSLGVAGDPEMQALAALARPHQPQANILFASVHFLLLGGDTHPLRRFYPSVTHAAPPDDDPYPDFVSFCRARRDALVPLITSGVTNTNEVRRSALLYPAFTYVARRMKAPLHLIELGPSAGFNLCFDRYAYAYRCPDSAETQCGVLTSPLVLACEARGPLRPPLDPHPPAVASRVGLELNPVDLAAPESLRWLSALIWPVPVERMGRFHAALALLRADPPPIRAGDAIALLPGVLADLAPGGVPVVVHTHVTYQFPRAAQEALTGILASASRARPLWRVGIEWDGTGYPLVAELWQEGTSTVHTLARTDPHGAHLTWGG